MQVIFLYAKGLWSAAGGLHARAELPAVSNGSRPHRNANLSEIKGNARGLSPGCRAPCEPRALQAQQPPPPKFRDHLTLTQLNWHRGTPGSQSGIKKLYFSSHTTLQDCENRSSVLSQVNLLWDILKILLLLKSSQSWFFPRYPPRFPILSTYSLPGRSVGRGRHQDSKLPGGVRQTPKCLSLQSNSSHMGGGKPCETLRHT